MKKIVSPVDKFPGTVTICDPMTFPQLVAWVDSSNTADQIEGNMAEKRMAWLPGIFACVEKWELDGLLENVTPENFPSTPFVQVLKLTNWLINEINAVVAGEETNPNA